MKTLDELITLCRHQANMCDANSRIWLDILMHLIELDKRRKEDEKHNMQIRRKLEM